MRMINSFNNSLDHAYYHTESLSFSSFFPLTKLCLIVSQEVHNSSQALQEEKEEVKRRLEEATARVIQLEEDLIGVTQKGLQKETELDKWVQDGGFGYMHRELYFYLLTRILKVLHSIDLKVCLAIRRKHSLLVWSSHVSLFYN